MLGSQQHSACPRLNSLTPARPDSLLASGLLHAEQLVKFARLEHTGDDVAAADELTVDVELRDGRPVREDLDAIAKNR